MRLKSLNYKYINSFTIISFQKFVAQLGLTYTEEQKSGNTCALGTSKGKVFAVFLEEKN